MDLVDARFQAFREAATRLRWFMMVTVLLSSLITIHAYLEKWGFQKQQLMGVHGERIRNHRLEKLACLKQVVSASVGSAIPADCAKVPEAEFQKWLAEAKADARLDEYSRQEFIKARTDNTLRKVTVEHRELPLLGMQVPINDYVPVLAVLLVVFTVGVWLNLRAVVASLEELSASREPGILRLAQLYFTFTVPLDKGRSHPFLQVVAFLAIWLPFLSLLFAGLVDNWPVLDRMLFRIEGHLGSIGSLVHRSGVLVTCALVILGTCIGSRRLVKRVDTMMRPLPDEPD